MTSILRPNDATGIRRSESGAGAGVKENTMVAAKSASKTRKTPAVKVTKSDRFRAMLIEGKTVAEIVASTGEGYPFVYGVAKRTTNPETGTSFATTNAKRRAVRAVHTVGQTVEIRPLSGGVIRVDLNTGAVKKTAK